MYTDDKMDISNQQAAQILREVELYQRMHIGLPTTTTPRWSLEQPSRVVQTAINMAIDVLEHDIEDNKLPEGQMEVEIASYKPSGKWYDAQTIIAPNVHMSKPEWLNWVRKNLPAKYGPGAKYTTRSTVRDIDAGNFHNALYTYEELFG